MLKIIPLNTFLIFIILSVTLLFIIHWFNIRKITTSEERLEHSRGSYLGFSFIFLSACWTLCLYSGASKAALLLSFGYTTSFMGDICNLQFKSFKKRVKEPVFIGILFFVVSQVLYIKSFVVLIGIDRLLNSSKFLIILSVLLVAPAVIFKIKVFSKNRPKYVMLGALFYGFFLGTMTAVALTGAILIGGYWIVIASGSVVFLISDAAMGSSTIKGEHPVYEFQIPWITYLVAQGLILFFYQLV